MGGRSRGGRAMSRRHRGSGKNAACTFNGHALFMEQEAYLPQYLHIAFGIEPLPFWSAHGLKTGKFSFPEAEHAGLKIQFSGGFTYAVHPSGLRLLSVHIPVLGLRAEEMAL
jgi:hypothetical protein